MIECNQTVRMNLKLQYTADRIFLKQVQVQGDRVYRMFLKHAFTAFEI